MEVSVSVLRAELKSWIEAARSGTEVVVTDRGVPVARLVAVDSADLITELQRDGLLTAPAEQRQPAQVPDRPASRAATPVAELVRRLRR